MDYQVTKVTKTCPHCETALEFVTGGRRLVFTAHDDAFCFLATRERVHMLEQVILGQRESYERHIERYKRDVNKLLAEHGLPSLEERAALAEAKARVMMQRLDLDRASGKPPGIRDIED